MAKNAGKTARPTKRDWTAQELDDNAKDFVACYGSDYFYLLGMSSSTSTSRGSRATSCVVPTTALFAAIHRAVKAAKAECDARCR